MSFTVFRSAMAALLLAAVLLILATPQAPVFAITGCIPNCPEEDFANRHNSADPTDPSKVGNDKNVASVAVDNLLKSAQRYIDAKKFDLALDTAKEALKKSVSDYEKLKSNQFLILVNVDLNDIPAATIAAEAAADLRSIPETDEADIYTNATILADSAGHYDKAANYARHMQALKLNDERSQRIINRALQDEAKTAKP